MHTKLERLLSKSLTTLEVMAYDLVVHTGPGHVPSNMDRLGGLVVKASASRGEDSRFESRLRRGTFPVSSHTSDFKIGTPVATLPGAWRYRVSAGTGRPLSVYCDWVRWKVGSAASVSVWQHAKLSE